ncbi:MAG TPA: hypothetical protein VMI94_01855 [Bryobacteraceae bacterium]|nr:hypothetical protein [Bryobacteraceae bacterium]
MPKPSFYLTDSAALVSGGLFARQLLLEGLLRMVDIGATTNQDLTQMVRERRFRIAANPAQPPPQSPSIPSATPTNWRNWPRVGLHVSFVLTAERL